MGIFNKFKKALNGNEKDANDDNAPKNTKTVTEIQEGSFGFLLNLIHSGIEEVNLNSDIVLDSSEESEFLDGILLDVDNFIINGNGHEINAQMKARIFEVTGDNVIIKNLTLKNGFSEDDGAAIYSQGNLKIIQCEFLDNHSDYGGAICCGRGKMEIENCRFSKNYGISGAGAIWNKRSDDTMIISNSTFINNRTDDGGGAIVNSDELEITGCEFSNNKADWDGGAIYNSGGIDIQDTHFTKNKVKEECGGAIYNYGGNMNIEKCVFSGNWAPTGELIWTQKNSLNISDCTYIDQSPFDIYKNG